MATRQTRHPGPSAPSNGSRTITLQDNQPLEGRTEPEPSTVGSLRLHGAARHRQRVEWREDVVDNEGAGKKKSKICCIYHRPREFDESSSDESSDDDSESDEGSDGRARPRRVRDDNHSHDRDHGDHPDGGRATTSRSGHGGGVVHGLESDSDDTNAYERGPRRNGKKGKSD